ncbi:MAG: fused MFS/spermidine synthase [Candidatus Aminicenantes bacterium]|nr:fused MFS/spermidine synthase [Candidatus Aminicenantes bacterium]
MNTTAAKPNNQKLYFLVFVLFFFSGISSLIYQIVWTRELVLIFGNTMLATSTVLSAFMAGLAAGSFVFGKFADKRPRNLIRVYALLEAGIGVFALLFPLLLAVIGPLYTGLYRSVEGNMLTLNLVRFAVCFVLIVVPTFLMGATLPVLLKRFVNSTATIGKRMGLFYGLNTIGAVVGSLLCGFLFLRLFGMRLSTLLAVVINLGVALLAWAIGKDDSAPEPAVAAPEKKKNSAGEYSPLTVKLVFLGIGISGFCALAYEVFWTRMLNLFFHNTVYSFTTILATFLTGIAIGSLIYARFLSKITNRIMLFIVVEIGIGVFAYATPYIFNLLYEPLFSKPAETLTVLKAGVIMIGPTILMGIALPLAVQICQRGPRREGDSVGRVYAINTVGSIFGAFAAGFILVPELGIHKSVIVVVCLNIIAGLLVLFSYARLRLQMRLAAGFVFACILVIMFVIAPGDLFRDLYRKKISHANLEYYKEGKIANVVVYDFYKNGYKDLYLNGIEEASSRLWHVQLFKMLGALPAVVHPQPDDALMIAFGAGMSAGTTVDLVDYFECAELNPDIYEEAEIFKKENRDVINNPKLNMVFNDGRNHLLLTPKKYSLIISDATNPLTFDSWTLYTQEFYQLCKEKLKPGGVFCQWVPIPLPSDALKVVLKTFKSVFPHTSFWSIYGHSQCLMLATPERLRLNYRQLAKELPAVLETTDLKDYGVETVEKFLSFFMLGEDELDEYLKNFDKINSDDLPDAQFHSGIDREGIDTALELLKHQRTILPYLTGLGAEKDRVQSVLENYVSISRFLNIGFLRESNFELSKAYAFASEVGLADDKNILCMLNYGPKRKEYFLDRAARFPDDANAHNSLGYIAWKEGDYPKAIKEFKRAIELKPDFARAYVNLGQALSDASKFDEAVEIFLEVKELNPTMNVLTLVRGELGLMQTMRKLMYQDDTALFGKLAKSYMDRGEISSAIEALKLALVRSPNDPNVLASLAAVYETLDILNGSLYYYGKMAQAVPGDVNVKNKIKELKAVRSDADARADWIMSRVKAPARTSDHPEGCGTASRKWNEYEFDGKISKTNLRAAAAEFEKVIAEDVKHMHAYADAATIYEHLGEYVNAAQLLRFGLAVSPGNRVALNSLKRLELLDQLHTTKPSGEKLVEMYNNIGVLYWQNGEIESAIVYFKKALKENPGHAMSWANLGANYIQSGRFREALRALEAAIKLNPAIGFADQIKKQMQDLQNIIAGIK